VSQRAIRLVLDTSAVLAYGRGDAVGETLREVFLNGSAFTVPVGCLAAVGRKVEPHMVELLLNHAAFEPWSVPLVKWRVASAAFDTLGSLDLAEALTAAILLDCDILTGDPGSYAVLGDEAPIIAL
jgi:hypothetical protein